jgi:hypothetical protein
MCNRDWLRVLSELSDAARRGPNRYLHLRGKLGLRAITTARQLQFQITRRAV